MEPVSVSVCLAAEDHRDYTAFVIAPLMRRFKIGLAILLAMAAAYWAIFRTDHSPGALSNIAIMFCIGAVVLWRASPKGSSLPSKLAKIEPVTVRYEIRDEGLYFESNAEHGVRRWDSFHRLVRNDSAIYLMISPKRGYIFPDRCFATSQDSAIFFTQLLGHVEAATRK